MKNKNIAVLLGGISAEREVSLRTGRAVCEALARNGHSVISVDVTNKTPDIPKDSDCVFIALHGTYGEDGQVQSYLQKLNFPYTGTGVLGSQVSFDKILSKIAFEKQGVITPEWQKVTALSDFSLEDEVVIKPPAQGSSVGINMASNRAEAIDILTRELPKEKVLLAERRIRGRELTVSILGEKSLPIVEIRPHSGVYDYQSKYTKGMTDYICPAELSSATSAKISKLAEAAHKSVGAEVYSRVDIMLDENEVPWVLEINTIPGMTETSLLPKAAAAAGISFDELCEKILNLSMKIQRCE